MVSVASCASSTTSSRSPARVPSARSRLGIAGAAPHDRRRERPELARVELRRPQLLLDLGILREERARGDPLGPPGAPPELREPGRVDAVLDGPHHEVAQLGAEPAERAHVGRERVGPLGAEAVADAALEQLADDLIVLGAREQGDRRAGVRPNELERDRVRGARERAPGGHPESHGERVAQRGGRRRAWPTTTSTSSLEYPSRSTRSATSSMASGRLAAAGRAEDGRVLACRELLEEVGSGAGALHGRNANRVPPTVNANGSARRVS